MMVILNPTDYDITVKWDGLDHLFKPDERKRVDDAMGRQVIHNYKARGLVTLEYGDEGDIEIQKIKDGRDLHDEFWTKQCVNYNQDNERRQQQNQIFVKPQPEVLIHAKRLGIKMLEPYKLEDSSSKTISLLMDQNKNLEKEIAKKDGVLDNLKNEVAELTKSFKQMMSLATGKAEKKTPAGDNGDKDFEELKATVVKMPKKRFVNWVVKNWSEIQSYPDDVIAGISTKHQNLFGSELPKDQPILGSYDV